MKIQIQLCNICLSRAGNVNTMFKLKGTGSVLLDMENQLQANIIRINVLGQENTSLHSAIEKLRQHAQRTASEVRLVCICVVLAV